MSQKIPRYLDVAVPLPLRAVFTYRVPESRRGCDEPGARAVVPVGRRLLTGFIVARRSEPALEAGRIKDVVELPDEAPVITPEVMRLARWGTRYYVAPPGAMLAAALPPGIGRSSEVRVRRREGAGVEGLPPSEREALEALPEGVSVRARSLGIGPALLGRLEARGLVELETVLSGPRVSARTARIVSLMDGIDPGAPGSRAPRQREIVEMLCAAPARRLRMSEIVDRLGDVESSVASLARKRLVRVSRIEVEREPHALPVSPAPSHRLTDEQERALGEVAAAIESGRSRSFLLMGVTGSGKTEVYLRAVERCLAAGRDALWLVPEIALTPLLARNLRSRLGQRLAILHSSLSPGERFDEWRRVREGRARVVLGARSAVLAPLGQVGLIVVDEEQDGSYKQEEDPRYNARDLALVRGRDSGAAVVLGSATPSVESYHAAVAGRHVLLRLSRRILERPMARVHAVDMREESIRGGRDVFISGALKEAVNERLARGEQAIVLLNRRGYAPFVLCRRCGSSEGCARCSISLTYHRVDDKLHCHYCGYRRGRPSACSTCRSDAIVLAGAGTQRLEEQLREAFPAARLARLDRDSARGRKAAAQILSDFERGDFNLLVGTQMVAKGHDFPRVTIVGVIGADSLLSIPDFRAAERTFQLVTQVAGRSGRGEEPGEVIVQAFHHDHYAIQAAIAQDYGAFYEKESRFRRIMKYPPFSVIGNVIVHASKPETGVKRSRVVGEALRRSAGKEIQVIGPSAAPIARLKGLYRYQVLLKSPSRRILSDALNAAAEELASKGLSSSREVVIDMDPVSLG